MRKARVAVNAFQRMKVVKLTTVGIRCNVKLPRIVSVGDGPRIDIAAVSAGQCLKRWQVPRQGLKQSAHQSALKQRAGNGTLFGTYIDERFRVQVRHQLAHHFNLGRLA